MPGVEVDSVARTHDRVFDEVRPVRQAKARRIHGAIRLQQRAPVACSARERARNGLHGKTSGRHAAHGGGSGRYAGEVDQPVIALAEGPEVLIAQAPVYGESAVDAEVVIGVPVQDVFAQIDLGEPCLDRGLLRQPEQEVGKRRPAGRLARAPCCVRRGLGAALRIRKARAERFRVEAREGELSQGRPPAQEVLVHAPNVQAQAQVVLFVPVAHSLAEGDRLPDVVLWIGGVDGKKVLNDQGRQAVVETWPEGDHRRARQADPRSAGGIAFRVGEEVMGERVTAVPCNSAVAVQATFADHKTRTQVVAVAARGPGERQNDVAQV